MSEPLAERREQILGQLAEWMHAAARDAQRRLLDAETPDDFAKLTGSLCKLARGVRQSILLQRKFEAERLTGEQRPTAPELRAAAAAAPSEPKDPRAAAVAKRKALITRAVERCVWNEYDDSDEDEEATACSLLRDFDDHLAEMAAEDAFLEADPDRLIAQFCAELGLDPPEVRPKATLAAALAPGGAAHTPDSS